MTYASELSFRTRRKNLETLSREKFDVLVIGGGITGVGIARDAALRGFSVALVERRDFAAGTSSRSSKLIHGGVRYLQQGDVGLVLEAASERRVIRRLVPHLARPLHLMVPVYSRGGYAKLSVGLVAYDRLAQASRNERHSMLNHDATLELEPALGSDKLYGAGVYYEYVSDDARLVLATLKSAAMLGAVAANYAEATGFLTNGDQIDGVTLRDVVSGSELAVHARVVVNAGGPWVDQVRLLYGHGEQRRLHLTKGIHVVVTRERLPVSRIVVMQTPDKRAVFCVPHDDVVYLGTTDTDYSGVYDNPRVGLEDVTYLLSAANATFDIDPLGIEDVIGAWAGLRPLLHEEGKKPSEISRKDDIMISAAGLISIAGGKLTTYRKMSHRVGTMVAARLREQGQKAPGKRGRSDREPLCGGETGDDVSAYTQRLQHRWPAVAPDIVARLVGLYGSEAERMVEAMAVDPVLRQRCGPSAAVTRGEVDYAVRAEMVVTLEDFLERRSRLMLYGLDNGLSVAGSVAQMLGAAMGWSGAEIAEAVTRYKVHVRETNSFRAATAEVSAATRSVSLAPAAHA